MLPNLEIVFCRRKHTKKKKKPTQNPNPRAQTAPEVRPSYLRRYGPGVITQPSDYRRSTRYCVCTNKNEFHMADRRVPSAPAAPAPLYLQGWRLRGVGPWLLLLLLSLLCRFFGS